MLMILNNNVAETIRTRVLRLVQEWHYGLDDKQEVKVDTLVTVY